MSTDDMNPEDAATEQEMMLAARLYFDKFISPGYEKSGFTADQVNYMRSRYGKDVLRHSPIAAWTIAKWYFDKERPW